MFKQDWFVVYIVKVLSNWVGKILIFIYSYNKSYWSFSKQKHIFDLFEFKKVSPDFRTFVVT